MLSFSTFIQDFKIYPSFQLNLLLKALLQSSVSQYIVIQLKTIFINEGNWSEILFQYFSQQ